MLINNCRLIPDLTLGFAGEIGAVQIEGKEVKSVFDHALNEHELLQLPEEDVVDAEGKTLIPGLIDMHTHITLLNNVGLNELHDPMQLFLAAAKQASRYLDYGFTTIRDCGSFHRVANYVKRAVESDLIEGPNVIACGLGLMTTEIDPDEPRAAHLFYADGAEEFRKAVRVEAAKSADFIKIFASGSAFNPTGKPQQPLMTEEELKSVVTTAHSKGLYVSAHCHSDSSIRACIGTGVDTIEHATFLSDASLELLAQRPDCRLVPTFSAMFVSQTDPAERKFWLDRLTPMLEACAAGIEKAYHEGYQLGFGTDSAPGSKQYEQGIEFRYRKEYCHMKDLDILRQATRDSAAILGIADRAGHVAKGMPADLVLVDGKPDQDISCLYHKPEKVWKCGRLVRDTAR